MNETQKNILNIIAEHCFKAKKEIGTPSKEVIDEAKLQCVCGLVCNLFSPYFVQQMAHNIEVNYEHAKLHTILHKNNIPYVILKGCSSSYYYNEPIRRSMGDVDFYVEPQYFAKAEELMKSNYKMIEQSHERHLTFLSQGGIELELHSEIKGIPGGKDGIQGKSKQKELIVRKYLADVVSDARLVKMEDGEMMLPSEFHHGLIMILHMLGHIVNDGGIGLRHLCDWAVYIDKVDIQQYELAYKEMGLWVFVCQLSACCAKYLQIDGIEKWCGKWEDELLLAIIDDFLEAGNFGNKDSSRRVALNLSSKDSFLKNIVFATQKRYPISDKCPIILPFMIAYYGLRYVLRVITGKREKINLKESVSVAKERNDLYLQFKIFE